MVDISYNGVSRFFKMEYKEDLRSVCSKMEEIISKRILSESDKGILDSVKDGTFKG